MSAKPAEWVHWEKADLVERLQRLSKPVAGCRSVQQETMADAADVIAGLMIAVKKLKADNAALRRRVEQPTGDSQ